MRARKRSPCRSITFSMRRISVMSEPMPRIILGSLPRRPLCDATRHRGPHRLDAVGEPGEDRLSDQKMADVEFDNLRQRGDRLGGLEIEAVTGVDFKAK